MRMETQHYLSLSRVLLGAIVLVELRAQPESWLVLPAVLGAAAADWLDGRVARGSGTASMAGRLIDNLCDFAFLSMCFAGFAIQEVWSDPVLGSATRYWEQANWLPLICMVAAFGLYLVRWAVCIRLDAPLAPSMRGHSAGIFNYVLAIVGAVAVLPGAMDLVGGRDVVRWVLEPSFVTVALLNATAVSENLLLLLQVRPR
jgi:phosphatidylglycerophosphate synthase